MANSQITLILNRQDIISIEITIYNVKIQNIYKQLKDHLMLPKIIKYQFLNGWVHFRKDCSVYKLGIKQVPPHFHSTSQLASPEGT